MNYAIREGDYAVMGVAKQGKNLVFTFAAERDKKCALLLYEKKAEGRLLRIEIPQAYCVGSLRSVCILNLDYREYDYNYEIDGQVLLDPYARKIVGREVWYDPARLEKSDEVRSGFDFLPFHWKEEKRPKIENQDMILYKLHVRGFTMDTTAKNKGTFAALQKKIPYLKELGVTSVELMPIYEFEEISRDEKGELPSYVKEKKKQQKKETDAKVNFWGYARGSYFAPKVSYAASGKASFELKKLIQAFHNNGMECIMEMFFPKEVNANEVIDALHYWVLQYHVDGFHLQGENIPISVITQDLLLRQTKLFYHWFDGATVTRDGEKNHLYFYNDEFIYPIRRMLCGRDASLYEFANQMRKQQANASYVNYICDNNGFTLADLFAYSEKHNEENGEKNIDGSDWSYSFNCGAEGPTKKKYILDMRKRLTKNAIVALCFSQGIPLIFSGDEFGNSQNGNNNAYCQDNEIGWVNWKKRDANRELYTFTKAVIRFRKEHPVIHLPEPMQMCDYNGSGFPDLSYHGEDAWLAGFEASRQAVGLLYGGSYAQRADGTKDDNVYVAFNFHLTGKRLALPAQEKGNSWYRVIDTAKSGAAALEISREKEKKQVLIGPQSIVVFVGKR